MNYKQNGKIQYHISYVRIRKKDRKSNYMENVHIVVKRNYNNVSIVVI